MREKNKEKTYQQDRLLRKYVLQFLTNNILFTQTTGSTQGS